MLGGMERTVHDAFAQVNRFARLNFDPGMPPGADRFRLAMEDGALWLSDLRPDAAASMEITESTFARFAAGTRRVAGPGVLRAVHVAHAAPAHADAYARLFGVPVTFASARTALVFDPSLATRAVAQQPRTVRAVVVAHAESRLAALDAATTTATRVAALVRAHLHGGAPAMAWVARELAMSRRTLHRRLADDGTSYDGVVDGVRREVALARLASPGASVKAVAHATGFSEPAAFTRAFRRWTGRTPSEALRQAG
ncbi:MAG: helix-turn-helix transcriptional regulator [Gemmatimonadaceae bacterium]|nr:helix-turn-helix transcriptional regulator [Gemmatimonadaceae bacterium]